MTQQKPSLRQLDSLDEAWRAAQPSLDRLMAAANIARYAGVAADAQPDDIYMAFALLRRLRRDYEGMIKQRDDQIHRKREARRILAERASAT